MADEKRLNDERRFILLPQHRRVLEVSGIHPGVITARQYRSVTSRAELLRLGFGAAQVRVPTLLIPIWNVAGEIGTYQIRPDDPRIVKGKAVKYETPSGSRMVIDVPPLVKPWLGDPKRPLFITEGARKADAAASRGICCIDLLGVWNWRGSNGEGGKVALPDWECIALNERHTFIAFDSDVMQKVAVHAALVRLKGFLEGRGAHLSVVRLPSNADGSKVGLDDYLAAGHDINDLLALAMGELPPLPDACDATAPYRLENGRICFVKSTSDGPVATELCNFDARVCEEVIIDDGYDRRRDFLIEGTLDTGMSLSPARVTAERFGALRWVTTAWGMDAIVKAGLATHDRLREAIQILSRDAKKRTVFAHTGWRQVDGRWYYFTSSGAVGADGFEVELGEALSRYALPRDPSCVVEAMRASLDLLGIAPASVTFPLWAAMFRAPLSSALPLDLALWIEGMTGSLKSTVAALFLAHYGSFDRTSLPANWSSTINALEKQAFTLKDAVLVIDDYAPGPDRRELENKAARILRAQGNLAGRARLKSDLSERSGFPPRGLIVGTGEQRPAGRSILARTFFLELDRKMIQFDRLNVSQQAARLLPHAMAGYIEWLAPQMPTLGVALMDVFTRTRRNVASLGTHLRIPEAVAHLWVGLDCGLSYAVDIGACSKDRASELSQQGLAALVQRANAQSILLEEDRPVRVYLQILVTLLTQQRVQLLPRNATIRANHGDCVPIGWYDDEHLYLIPEAAFQAVNRFARDSGEPFPVSDAALRRDLARDEVSVREKGRLVVSARAGDAIRRVLKLRRAAVEAVLGADLPLPKPVVTGVTGSAE